MKTWFPNIWKKEVKARKQKYPSLSVDLNDYHSRFSSETPHKQEEILEKELNRLDSDLDASEIQALNSNVIDFHYYKTYLEGIAAIIKHKSTPISLKIYRGVHGWEKSMKKLDKSPVVQYKVQKSVEIEYQEAGIQTDDHEERIQERDHEVLKFLNLKKSIKRIHLSKLTQKLRDIYDKLRVIQVDIPSFSYALDPTDIEKAISMIEDEIPEASEPIQEVKHTIQTRSRITHKYCTDKQTQTDSESSFKDKLNIDGEINKEVDLMRCKRQLQTALSENKSLKLTLEKMHLGNGEGENEGKRRVGMEDEGVRERGFERDEQFKKKFEKASEQIIALQHKLSALNSNCNNIRVLWKINEAKIAEIEKAWKDMTGELYRYRKINIKKIMGLNNKTQYDDSDIIKKMIDDLEELNKHEENSVKVHDVNHKFEIETDNKRDEHIDSPKDNDEEKKTIIKESKKHGKMNVKELKNIKEKKIKVEKEKEKEIVKEKVKEKELKISAIQSTSKKLGIDQVSISSKESDRSGSNSHFAKNSVSTKRKQLSNTEDSEILEKIYADRNNDKIQDILKETKEKISLPKKNFKEIFNQSPRPKVPAEEKPIYTPEIEKKTLKIRKKSNTPYPPTPKSTTKQRLIDYPVIPQAKTSNEINLSKKHVLNPKHIIKTLTLENVNSYLSLVLAPDQAQLLQDFIVQISVKSENIPEKDYEVQITPPLEDQIENSAEIPASPEDYIETLSIKFTQKPKLYYKKNFEKAAMKNIFTGEEIQQLPPGVKSKVKMSLAGHSLHCDNICKHLKRALAIKYKTFGVRYPINTPDLNLSL